MSVATSIKTKRKPYTHLACDLCKEKHLKCDGKKPICGNCLSKRIECRYRGERNRKRDSQSRQQQRIEDDLLNRIHELELEIDRWKSKFYHLSLIAQQNNIMIPSGPPLGVPENSASPISPISAFESEDDEVKTSSSPSTVRHHHILHRPRSYSLPDTQFIPFVNTSPNYIIPNRSEPILSSTSGPPITKYQNYQFVDPTEGIPIHMNNTSHEYPIVDRSVADFTHVPPTSHQYSTPRSKRSISQESPMIQHEIIRRRTNSLGPVYDMMQPKDNFEEIFQNEIPPQPEMVIPEVNNHHIVINNHRSFQHNVGVYLEGYEYANSTL